MMVARWPRLLTLTAAWLLCACGGADDPGDRGDPDAPVDLWPIPRTGLSEVPKPWVDEAFGTRDRDSGAADAASAAGARADGGDAADGGALDGGAPGL